VGYTKGMSNLLQMTKLMARAAKAIKRREQFVYDLAAETCSMVENVADTRWFRNEVARRLTEDYAKWKPLNKHFGEK